MADEPKRSKAIGPPMCKICGHAHRYADPHVFGKSSAGSPSGKAAGFDPATAGSNPAPATSKPRRATGGAKPSAPPALAVAREALTAAIVRTSKPKPKKKGKRPMTEKQKAAAAAKRRGRPTVEKSAGKSPRAQANLEAKRRQRAKLASNEQPQ